MNTSIRVKTGRLRISNANLGLKAQLLYYCRWLNPPVNRRKKILIIDDEKDLCELIQLILKGAIVQIDCAFTLKEGNKKWDRQHPFIVLLDNNLPDGCGLNMIEHYPSLLSMSKVIMITADTYPLTRKRAQTAGIPHFIQKPFSLKVIRELVHNILV